MPVPMLAEIDKPNQLQALKLHVPLQPDKLMTTFAGAPPTATVLSFLPKDNNIIAIGLDDSTIRIYNIHQDEILSKLEGHNQKITSIAISSELDVLVSAGADCQDSVARMRMVVAKGSQIT
ncbi:Protein tpr3 [Ancistrocladus abbreviatus]